MKRKPMDRETIFADERPGGYLWCLHCERAYKWGEYLEIDGLQMCPFEGCNGDTVMDGWHWEEVLQANPDYPDVPEIGKHYPLYRSEKSVTPEFRRFKAASKGAGGLMSSAQAAEILGISRQRFADMVKAGQVRQHNFFGRDYVSGNEVSKLSEKPRKPGRPKKSKTVDKCS
jgi:hypothetical protein